MTITSKQRAYLRGLAMTMDSVYQIGKDSLTPEIIKGLDEVLEARELIKVSVQKNCEDDVRVLADMASERTRSVPVQVIGRKFVLYRPAKKPVIVLPN